MIGLHVNELMQENKIDCVVFDSKKESKKDLLIWEERTKGRIPYISLYRTNYQIPYFFIESHSSKEMCDLIASRNISLLINCGTPRILRGDLLNRLKIGVLNCHPGILPNYRGCTCVEWALYNCDEVGNTCHLMTTEIDEGPIIFISKINIESYKSYESIRIANYLDSIKSIDKAISILISGKYCKDNYPKNGMYYKPINKEKMKKVYKKYGRIPPRKIS